MLTILLCIIVAIAALWLLAAFAMLFLTAVGNFYEALFNPSLHARKQGLRPSAKD